MSVFLSFVWATYLATAPVYWLPGIGPGLLLIFKTLAVSSAVLLAVGVLLLRDRLRFPGGIAGPAVFVVLVLASVFGMLQAESDVAVKTLRDYFFGFTAFYAVYALKRQDLLKDHLLALAALFIVCLCALVCLAEFAGAPALKAPAVFNGYPVTFAGFSSLRTGWSNGISLYVAFLFIPFCLSQRYRLPLLILAFAGSFVILTSQFVVGGRAGMLATLLALVLISYRVLPKPVLALIVFVAAQVVLLNMDLFYEHLRLDRLDEQQVDLGDVDHFSAGRVGSYLFALEKFAESPLFGHGFGNVKMSGHHIHNMWLRILAEAGLFPPLIFGVFLAYVLARKKQTQVQHKALQPHQLYKVVLLQGVLISMLEPSAILGAFQNSANWWVSLGMVLAYVDSESGPDSTAEKADPPAARSQGALFNYA